MIIDHIGIVVRNLEKGLKHWITVFGYKQITEPVINFNQKVRVVFLGKDNSITIKLVEPTGKDSAVYKLAHRGGGLHHLCFKTEDIKDKIVELREKRIRVLTEPEPGEAFAGENIAFLYAKHGLNIELIDTDKLAGRI